MIRFVNTGFNRWVLLVGSWAIKVPRMSTWRSLLFGLLNNMNEATIAPDSEGACPILLAVPGGWAVVMRRARIMTDEEFARFDSEEFCRRHGLVAEHKPDSYGFVDGRPVCVDFGWLP